VSGRLTTVADDLSGQVPLSSCPDVEIDDTPESANWAGFVRVLDGLATTG
jgi:hypothetical protein